MVRAFPCKESLAFLRQLFYLAHHAACHARLLPLGRS
jgi:hypothetical protein